MTRLPIGTILTIAALLFLAGLANGVMDTLQFHYSQSIFDAQSEFWNPNLSWRNKWAQDAEGNLLYPLRAKYFGSSTFLVWTTDAWHLLQTIMFAAFRTAAVLGFALFIRISHKRWLNVLAWAGVWIVLIVVQAAGFHLMYSWALLT